MELRCPHCHHGFDVASRHARKVQCPRCGKPGARPFKSPPPPGEEEAGEGCELPGVFAAGGSLVASVRKVAPK